MPGAPKSFWRWARGLGCAVADILRCSSSYVRRWRERFLASRLAGLVTRPQGRKMRPYAVKQQPRSSETGDASPSFDGEGDPSRREP
jgi:hypothetical protein